MHCALFGVICNRNISWLHILSYLFLTKRSLVMWELCQGNCPAWMKCLHHWEHSLSRGERLEIAREIFTDSPGIFTHHSLLPTMHLAEPVRKLNSCLRSYEVFSAMCWEGKATQILENTSDICLPLGPWVKTIVNHSTLLVKLNAWQSNSSDPVYFFRKLLASLGPWQVHIQCRTCLLSSETTWSEEAANYIDFLIIKQQSHQHPGISQIWAWHIFLFIYC